MVGWYIYLHLSFSWLCFYIFYIKFNIFIIRQISHSNGIEWINENILLNLITIYVVSIDLENISSELYITLCKVHIIEKYIYLIMGYMLICVIWYYILVILVKLFTISSKICEWLNQIWRFQTNFKNS